MDTGESPAAFAHPTSLRIDLRPLTLRNSELMAQHQDLGVLPPRLAARQPERTGYRAG